MQAILHYSLHLLAPGLIAWVFFRENWKTAWLIMLGTMIIDLDHLLATPIFDPYRCSVGFHPLHSYTAIGLYPILLFFQKTRVIGIGLLFHILTDLVDCWLMPS